MRVCILLLTLFALSLLVSCSKLSHCESSGVIKDHYIVVYNDTVTVQSSHHHLLQLGVSHKHRYTTVLNGFSATLTKDQLIELMNDDMISSIECDQVVTVADCTPIVDRTSWGLTRIAETEMSLNGKYSYPGGKNDVDAYIIDTGIYVDNNDFGGRAVFGFKAEDSWSVYDMNGHGTHVASTVGGLFYGVAPNVKSLIAVKVLGDNGSGSNSGVIAGVEWVGSQHKHKKTASVANLSLGGGLSTQLNKAVNKLMKSGVVVVVAAGNDNIDACENSPASAEDVITVCSTAVGVNNVDVRSSFSNYGSCVNICAPGSSITAAWIGNAAAIRTISGTSMASPHVAGVAALILSNEPDLSSDEVADRILGDATDNKIQMQCGSTACTRTPNKMLFNGCIA